MEVAGSALHVAGLRTMGSTATEVLVAVDTMMILHHQHPILGRATTDTAADKMGLSGNEYASNIHLHSLSQFCLETRNDSTFSFTRCDIFSL